MGPKTKRVLPFVEDRRNCLVLQPEGIEDDATLASLQAALKAAILLHFQLEDAELAAEPLPDEHDRRAILFYEAAEGGAGVLKELVEGPKTLAAVAARALEVTHFDKETGADEHRAPGAQEDCEAACYDCLLSYYNQREHRMLDRHLVRDLLLAWSNGSVDADPEPEPIRTQISRMQEEATCETARQWLDQVNTQGLHLPLQANAKTKAGTPIDFEYPNGTAVLIAGSPHDRPGVVNELEDQGWFAIRFEEPETWAETFAQYASTFGNPPSPTPSSAAPETAAEVEAPTELPLDLFDDPWHSLVRQLSEEHGVTMEPGGDVMAGDRVAGQVHAWAGRDGARVALVSAGAPEADVVAQACRAGGDRCLLLDPTAADAAARVLELLEGES